MSKKIETKDKYEYITFQMWDFMSIFGPSFYLGSLPVTEDNNIIIPDTPTYS
jgi:hypothetical protein